MLSSILLTFSVVESLLRGLDIRKAYEPVSLPTGFFFFLRMQIFWQITVFGTVPKLWKEPLVIPIHKKKR